MGVADQSDLLAGSGAALSLACCFRKQARKKPSPALSPG
jgi:hypothetical protein